MIAAEEDACENVRMGGEVIGKEVEGAWCCGNRLRRRCHPRSGVLGLLVERGCRRRCCMLHVVVLEEAVVVGVAVAVVGSRV